jgi:hypothetical protein
MRRRRDFFKVNTEQDSLQVKVPGSSCVSLLFEIRWENVEDSSIAGVLGQSKA